MDQAILGTSLQPSLISKENLTLQEIGALRSPFKLIPLSYAFEFLVPTIDAKTMEIHYEKHHQNYVDHLNQLVDEQENTMDLQTIFNNVSILGKEIKNNAGGHWNHTFFWTLLTADKEKQKMPARLLENIEEHFGSIDEFKEKFEEKGNSLFGSGWVWLVRDEDGKLAITTTSNQDNPLMDIFTQKSRPIFTIDVWEHAYYLSYLNKRADYLSAIWNIINWSQVDIYDREITAH